MRLAPRLLLLASIVFAPIPDALAAELSRVRLGTDGATTRVVMETTRSLPATILQPSPDRITVDVTAAPASTLAIDPPRGLVDGIGLEAVDGGTRLHLTLRASARIAASFALAPGPRGLHRYVVDLAPARAPAVALGAPRPTATRWRPLRRPSIEVPQPSATPTEATVAAGSPVGVPTVVIDPGHGGVDPGAEGPNGLLEKDLTLAVARLLRDRLRGSGGVEVLLTRDGDASLTLARRREIAAAAGADLFVSLHADSLPEQPFVRGAAVYTLSPRPSDAQAARRAQEENAADARVRVIAVQEDETVRAILTSIMQTSTAHRSIAAADRLTDDLGAVTPLVNRARRSANFVVLRSLHTPSVLVELGYLSNADDARLLADPEHLERLAAALHRAVTAHLGID